MEDKIVTLYGVHHFYSSTNSMSYCSSQSEVTDLGILWVMHPIIY